MPAIFEDKKWSLTELLTTLWKGIPTGLESATDNSNACEIGHSDMLHWEVPRLCLQTGSETKTALEIHAAPAEFHATTPEVWEIAQEFQNGVNLKLGRFWNWWEWGLQLLHLVPWQFAPSHVAHTSPRLSKALVLFVLIRQVWHVRLDYPFRNGIF